MTDRKPYFPALSSMASEMKKELTENILPFWLKQADRENGGFYGHILNDGSYDATAPKGLVMHARLLWTYSAAYRLFKRPEHRDAARHAYDFLVDRLKDKDHGGYWWAVDSRGKPGFREKVIYGQAFALYGLSEYYRAFGDADALEEAKRAYSLIESTARDRAKGGYYEACAEDWSAPIAKALSEVDIPCQKSMNTNLHVMEALSAFRLAGGGEDCLESLKSCLDVYLDKVLQDSGRLSLYFDGNWKSLSDHRSYGHEIESCWLAMEAGGIAYGKDIPARIRERALSMARECLASLKEFGGSLPNELHNGKLDQDRVWWVQAESVVGFAEAFELTGNAAYSEASAAVWEFIKAHIVDRKGGDWFWAVSPDGKPIAWREKGGMWKACYHNGRACMEIMRRAGLTG